MARESTLIAHTVLALSALLGGVSLLAFGLALALGPFEILGLGLSPKAALLWDGGLCLVFFVQHSGMVRASFRALLGRRVPEHYHLALYSMASGIALLLLVGLWQTPDLSLLVVQGAPRWILRGVFVLTGAGFLWAVRSLGSFDTFGLEPIRSHLRGRASRSMPLAIRGPYRWVRHPLYSLFLVLLWSCPDVTADRLLFNGLFTVWIVAGTLLEERDLVDQFGEPYREYQRQVPMLIPWRKPRGFS